MKISSLFIYTANADLFLPQQGTDPVSLAFADAVQYCKDHFDGSLANPANYQTQQLLDATHGITAWIGIYRSSAQVKLFPISTEASVEQLVSDAQPVAWNWYPGEPNNHDGAQYCGRIYSDGKLDDYFCFSSLPFLCEGTYQGSRSGAAHTIVDAESAAIIKETQKFENQQIRFNDFLDAAIKEAEEMSEIHALRLKKLKKKTMLKIQFSERNLCDENPYAKDRYQAEFYFWHLSRNNSKHDNVCEFFRDVHDGIVHFIHEFGCTGDFKAINRKLTNLVPQFCPDLNVQRKPLGVNF